MNDVLVRPKNQKEKNLVLYLMKHLNISSYELSDEMEETALINSLKEVDKKRYSSKSTVLSKLRNKR